MREIVHLGLSEQTERDGGGGNCVTRGINFQKFLGRSRGR